MDAQNPACQQQLYVSQAVAAQQAHLDNQTKGAPERLRRPYYCLRCGGWHIALLTENLTESLTDAMGKAMLEAEEDSVPDIDPFQSGNANPVLGSRM